MSDDSTVIALTVDVEGEWFGLPGEQGFFDLDKVVAAVRHLEVLLERLESKIGVKIPVTWFIRCDDSVAVTTGVAAGLLQELDSFISRRATRGDEFGLHPHLYRFSQGKWTSETNPAGQKAQVERAALAWKRYFGSAPKLLRMGEAMMNNSLAGCLDELDIEVDASALADRKRFDNGFQFDWTGTPTSPYRPSVEDYRRPAKNGETARRFLEIPFTMFPILGNHDEIPIKRYCNLAFRPDLLKSAVQRMKKAEDIIAVVHPHELLSGDHRHPLIAHNPTSLEENILNFSRIFGGLEFTLLTTLSDGRD